MSRPKMKSILALLSLSISTAIGLPSGSGADWDVSPADRADYYPSSHLSPFRFDDAPFIVRAKTLRKHGPRVPSPINGYGGLDQLDGRSSPYGRIRQRRDLASVDADMEKIAGTKNVREARMNSPEAVWSKQPLAVQFRQRSSHDRSMPADAYDDAPDNDEAANLPPLIRAHYAPKTDFVTSGRSRAAAGGAPPPPPPPPPPEGRESREMPMARSYDEYDVPIFRNIVREHDFDVQIPRNYYYPNRYRSQRDYYYRGAAGNPYAYDRYRDEEEDYELYGRYRPTPKPKRIIYYATLPDIVRKPADVRNAYPRPYDPLVRPEAQLEPERTRLATSSAAEPSRRPLRYPYDNYDNYVKRSSYYDRRRPSFAADEDDRPRDLERGRVSYKDKMRSDDRKLESQMVRSGDDRRLPWPVQIGTEVNVKENERIPGRKIFGQIEGYERYEGSRIKKTSGNAERKEDVSDNSKNNSNSNNDSSNN